MTRKQTLLFLVFHRICIFCRKSSFHSSRSFYPSITFCIKWWRAFPLHHMRQTGFYCLVSHFGSVEKQIADKWTSITAICFRQTDLWNVFIFSGVFLHNGRFDGPKLGSWTLLTWIWKLNTTDPFSQSVWFLCFQICGTNFWSGDYWNFEI